MIPIVSNVQNILLGMTDNVYEIELLKVGILHREKFKDYYGPAQILKKTCKNCCF
jgi:hypothetical protein